MADREKKRGRHNIGTFADIIKHKHFICLFSLLGITFFEATRTAYTIENDYTQIITT